MTTTIFEILKGTGLECKQHYLKAGCGLACAVASAEMALDDDL
jgi:hypothetical protein